MRLIVGIDEVGRGPLAGPVAVGIVVVKSEFEIEGLTDSKKMTEKAREKVYALAEKLQQEGAMSFGVFSLSAKKVDEWGIEKSIFSCISLGLKKLAPDPVSVQLKLDGRLKAPKEYRQEAIVRGDALVPVISLASVVAKVERDRYMKETLHPQLPEYGFDTHKGYGTTAHITAIKRYGISPFHRVSFLSSL